MANNWAIVVGINNYKFLPNASLKFAEQDALAIRQFLCAEAGFAANQVLLCGDGAADNREATRAVLRHILLNELHRAQNADNLWFFFSGHGLSDQRDYLMPIDGNPHDLHDTGISIQFVVENLRACKAKNIVLILDMCRNERPKMERKSVESVEALQQLVQDREGQQGIITLFSCGRDESSYELPGLGQGAFTHALLEGLRRQSILRDLEAYLARRVPELHWEAGRATRKQVPLVIPEPGWKYEEPILSHYVAAIGVARLKEMAIDAECDEEFEKAIQLWRQINLVAERQDDRQRALKKVEQLLGQWSTPVSIHISNNQISQMSDQNLGGTIGNISNELHTLSKSRVDTVPLESEKGIDYRKLRDLLKDGKWEEADKETFKIMLNLTQCLEETFKIDDISRIPCQDLQNIDNLWISYSNHKFGLATQRKFYEEVNRDFIQFSEKVAWRQGERWLQYSELIEEEHNRGQFPAVWLFQSVMRSKKASSRGRWRENLFSALMHKLIDCNI